MKLKYLIFSILIVGLASCKKGDSYDVSNVTTFASFEYEPEVILEVGDAFTPSAVAIEGDKTLDVAISGSADVNTVGVYDIVYAATNSDGYDGTVSQTVIVFDPLLTGTDVSGNINDIGRPERTGIISKIEGTTNIFYCTDMGFGGAFPIYFQMIGDVMDVIPQSFIFGATTVNGTYDAVAKTFHIEILPQGFTYDFEYSN